MVGRSHLPLHKYPDMRAELTFSPVWQCPACGRRARVPNPQQKIACSCGLIWSGNAIMGVRQTQQQDGSEETRRRAICHNCEHWMDHDRCSAIDLGCRQSFVAAIKHQWPTCPLGKWSSPLRISSMRSWPGVQTLNLIYHVCPLTSNDVWRANVRQVVRRLPIFNGRKVVAVATGPTLHAVDEVRRAFGDPGIEYLELPNDPQLREVATFLPLLEAVESTAPDEASFYAHTKGNSTRDSAFGAELWRNAMYHHLLDHANVCRDLLMKHPCVGTHKIRWPAGYKQFPSGLQHGHSWMFAGTFYWFRHDAVFAHPHWRDVPRDRYGAEAWLSGLFEPDEAATVFQPWPANEHPTPSPYDPRIYLWPIRDVP